MPDITKGVRAFTVGTAVSRIFGLLRESVFAYLFGAGTATDAFNAAFRIPNLFRDLFAETALSAAFIPVLTSEKEKGKKAQNLLASNIFNVMLIVAGAVVVLGIVFSPILVKIITFGFGAIPGKLDLTAQLTAVIFPFLLFIAFASWAMGYLNTEQEFFIPSLAPAFFNIVSIAIPIIMYIYLVNKGTEPIFGMAIGVALGGFIQFIIQLPRLFQRGFRYHFYLNFKDAQLRKVLTLFVPVAVGLAASRINVTVDMFLISFLAERSMTWLNYAYRIMHLPLGLFGIAVGTVALPTLSQLVAQKNHEAVKQTFIDSLKLVLFLTVSTAAIIAFLSHPITRLIYERGKFTSFDTNATTQALILYIIGIPFIACIRNVAAVFYSYRDSRTPMYASFIGVGINIILNLVLMRIIGFRAFPLATSVASCANLMILLIRLPRKIGPYGFNEILKYFILLSCAAIIAGATGYAIHAFVAGQLGVSFLNTVINLLISGSAAALMFYGACLLFGIKEARLYIARLTKK
jgi:putative peptidoglycan lipid II flippase